MPKTNIALDEVPTLDLHGFTGNAMTLRMVVLGEAPMPNLVEAWAELLSGRVLSDSHQPTITIINREILISYPARLDYPLPGIAIHLVRFDHRTVLAGSFGFDQKTTITIVNYNVTINTSSTHKIELTIVDAPIHWSAVEW